MAFRVLRSKRTSGGESDARKAKRLGFRSGGEMLMTAFLERRKVKFLYEERSLRIPYTVPESLHHYLPDFFLKKKDGTIMYIDYKGEWDAEDRRKHLLIQQQHPDLDIRMVFERDPHKQFIGAKGKSATYADICTKGSGRSPFKDFSMPFTWVKKERGRDPEFLPAEWLKECEVK